MGYPKTAAKCEEMAGELLGCFVAGTAVQMADGTTKTIEKLKPGDLVWSRDPSSGDTQPKRVMRTSVRHVISVLDLTFADSTTGTTEHIVTTTEHPFYVDGQGFLRAGSLGIGTQIVTRAGPSVSVTATEERNDRDGYTVYNLTVDGDHTYFVGTLSGGVWVHNAAVCEWLAALQAKLEQLLVPMREALQNAKIDDAIVGYRGSFKTGIVGNRGKPTYGMPINPSDYDIDVYIESSSLWSALEKVDAKLSPDGGIFLKPQNAMSYSLETAIRNDPAFAGCRGISVKVFARLPQ